MDFAALLARARQGGMPPDEESLIDSLEKGVLTKEQVRTLTDLRRFRNVLVHQYARLDHARVHDHALRAKEDVPALLAAMLEAAS